MKSLTDILVGQLLSSLDPTPVKPTKEQLYLSFLVCKNLADLCETGRAILNDIECNGNPTTGLPEREGITICESIVHKFYTDDMFIVDDELGNKPNWNAIKSFDNNNSYTAFRIYRAIHKNVVSGPVGSQIRTAVINKDKKFFLQNFDLIFTNIPFKEALIKFKNFISSPYASDEHQNYVWDFFDSLLDLFIKEREHLNILKTM